MRGGYRRATPVEEEESVFVSMTDMTVSFLFVIMILLAFFASQISLEPEVEMVPKSDLDQVMAERDTLVLELETASEELAELTSLVESLLAEVSDLKEQLRHVTAKSDQLQHRVVALEQELRLLSRELADQKARNAALEQENAHLARDLAASEEERRKLSHELEQERERRQTAETSVSLLESEVARLRLELERLRRSVRDPLEAYFAAIAAEREELLKRLRDAVLLEFPELEVVISAERDVLRFQGDGLFRSGSSIIRSDRRALVNRIADKLNDLLPCFTLGPRSSWNADCNGAFAVLEAVQIEGHTDSDGTEADNIWLSARRSATTYIRMTEHAPELVDYVNPAGQPVLSLAGYGESRPLADNNTLAGKSANRRIDLRFIMVTPRSSDEIERIRLELIITSEDGQAQ